MSKLEALEVPPATVKELTRGAFLSHVDHCKACNLRSDTLKLSGEEVQRVMKYDPCVIGKFLLDLWKESQ